MKIAWLKKRRVWIILTALLAIAGLFWRSSNRPTMSAGKTAVIERGELPLEVPITGTLSASRSVDLTAPLSNDPHMFKIAQMAAEGSRVEAGQLIMELDTQEVDQKLREYQAELGKNEEELNKRRLEYDVQTRDLRVLIEDARVKLETARHKLNADPQIQSARERREFQIEFDQAEQQASLLAQKLQSIQSMSKAELSVFENNIEKNRIRVVQIEDRKKECSVKAPISGTLIYKTLWGNTKRKVGEQTCHHEVILQIPDLNTLRLDATIEEAFAGRVQPSQRVQIKLDALPDEKITGKVLSVGTVLRMRRWDNPVKVVDAVVELDQKIGKLSPGMTATGQVEVENITGALLAPVAAVHERAGQIMVKVATPSGQTEERAIRVGRKNQRFVEILEGLRQGERVVLE